MKIFALIILCNIWYSFGFCQSNGPQQLSPTVLAQIKSDVEKQAQVFKKQLKGKDLSALEISFTLDTFRIERTTSMKMNVDYSTAGMNKAMIEKAIAYDLLLNNYYKLLMGKLKPADKTALIAAQRAWITFRDAEKKLIATLAKTEYSGGGTIQSNIVYGSYTDLVVRRTLAIFDYYRNLLRNKE